MDSLHQLLDWDYGPDGDAKLRAALAQGAGLEDRHPDRGETPLHVATRRRRLGAATILLDAGADIDARNAHDKTSYAHAVRRRFTEMAELFADRGADTALAPADAFAVAVVELRLDDARRMLDGDPALARTGNPEEDRLLADVAGRAEVEPVELLIAAGADLDAPALDGGGPLHQAAWFGQPQNARRLVEAGATLELVDPSHRMTPLGWAVHGSRYSGGAVERQEQYLELVDLLLAAGAQLEHPAEPGGDAYLRMLQQWAGPEMVRRLRPR